MSSPGSATLRSTAYGADVVQHRHSHEFASVSLVVRGGVCETAWRPTGRAEHNEGRPGMVVVKPIGTPHADRFGPKTSRLISVRWDDHSTHALGLHRLRYQWLSGGPAARALINLARSTWNSELGSQEALAALAGAIAPSERARPCSGIAARARRLILERLSERLRFAEIARELGVHPVYLARTFRATHGTTMSRFLHRERVIRGAELIVNAGSGVGSVSATLGYCGPSHFCAAFRNELGVSTAEFRSLSRRGASSSWFGS